MPGLFADQRLPTSTDAVEHLLRFGLAVLFPNRKTECAGAVAPFQWLTTDRLSAILAA